ncbi:MAG: hypothetical protein GY679_05515 [Mycoplasma sp.]|nr:hypothetical protein [Mycoplasma sp.]
MIKKMIAVIMFLSLVQSALGGLILTNLWINSFFNSRVIIIEIFCSSIIWFSGMYVYQKSQIKNVLFFIFLWTLNVLLVGSLIIMSWINLILVVIEFISLLIIIIIVVYRLKTI